MPGIALLGIILLGGALRFLDFTLLPMGLSYDEGLEAYDALKIIDGNRPLFLGSPDPREPLYAYLASISISVFGRTPAATRLPAALASTGTLLGIYLISNSLYGKRVGMLATLFAAFSTPMIVISRFGVPQVLFPLVLSLAVWAGLRAWKGSSLYYWPLSGALLGLAFYTYSPVRAVALIVPLLAVGSLLLIRTRRLLIGWTLFILAWGLIAGPLLIYNWDAQVFFYPNFGIRLDNSLPENFNAFVESFWNRYYNYRPRVGVVSILEQTTSMPELISLIRVQTIAVLRGFVIPGAGDMNYRSNIAGTPLLNPWAAFLFIVGVFAGLRARRRAALIFIGLLLIFGALPAILSDVPPHFGRSGGVWAVLFVLPALGLRELYDWLQTRRSRISATIIGSAFLVGSFLLPLNSIWVQHHFAQPVVQAYFHWPRTEMSVAINQFLGSGWIGSSETILRESTFEVRQVWVDENLWGNWQQLYLTGRPDNLILYDAKSPLVDAQLSREVLFVVGEGSESQTLAMLESVYDTSISTPEWASSEWFADVPVERLQRLDWEQDAYMYIYAMRNESIEQ